MFLDLSAVKMALEEELRKCNSSCKESLENYVANMSTNADFQQVSDGSHIAMLSHAYAVPGNMSGSHWILQYITEKGVNMPEMSLNKQDFPSVRLSTLSAFASPCRVMPSFSITDESD
jgi:hypothetical protein